MSADIDILKHDVAELKQEIASLKVDIKNLTNAWLAMKGTANFLKWFVSFIIAVGTAWTFLKDHLVK